MTKNRLVVIGLVAAVVVGIGAYRVATFKKPAQSAGGWGGGGGKGGGSTPVSLIKAAKGSVKSRLRLTGVVKGENEVVVYPRVSGKLLKNLVREGETVKKGQPLGQVDRDEPSVKYEPSPILAPVDGCEPRRRRAQEVVD